MADDMKRAATDWPDADDPDQPKARDHRARFKAASRREAEAQIADAAECLRPLERVRRATERLARILDEGEGDDSTAAGRDLLRLYVLDELRAVLAEVGQ